MNSIITLGEYVGKKKTFVIPDYQRGYIWGKNRKGETNSVEYLLEDLKSHYEKKMDVFLQGVTVNESNEQIVLIDGQQRTTFLYFLLKKLGLKEKLTIQYTIRKESNDFLCNEAEWIDKKVVPDGKEPYQDLYFFKKTLSIIDERMPEDKGKFLDFLLNRVSFLYINIRNANDATRVFSKMNGSKAEMLQEEIIKAEILRLASLDEGKTDVAREWENNMLRSRYAREWDKWLHWWNREDVQTVFGCSNPMGLLVSTYMPGKEVLTFESFKKECLSKGQPIDAKKAFDGLRRLQKRFEDAFNGPRTRNWIGAILNVSGNDGKDSFIRYYFGEGKLDEEGLRQYYLAVFLGLTHREIVEKDGQKFKEKYDKALDSISADILYDVDNDLAFRTLLRLNVDQDIKQNRLFDFKIWKPNVRSLEHIQPKSKVYHTDNNGKLIDGNGKDVVSVNGYLNRDDIKDIIAGQEFKTTEHSIGNLVLLYKDENSKFNDAGFAAKKKLFFDPLNNGLVKSRHLLHSICVFAENEKWDGPAIARNHFDTIKKFIEDYAELRTIYGYEKQD